MCYMLYLGADAELPLIPGPDFESLRDHWPKDAPLLIIEPLKEDVLSVRQHFSEAHVVYAGSFEGCGCGFNRCVTDEDLQDLPKDEEDLISVGSRKALHDYVRQQGVSTLYGCWSGDEDLPCEGEEEISVDALGDRAFGLPEKIKLKVAGLPQAGDQSA